jgi:hypothetical protein
VFDPGLGQVRAGFFFSRYGFNFRAPGATPKTRAKTNSARKSRAGLAGLIAGSGAKSRRSRPESTEIQAVWGISARSRAVLCRP